MSKKKPRATKLGRGLSALMADIEGADIIRADSGVRAAQNPAAEAVEVKKSAKKSAKKTDKKTITPEIGSARDTPSGRGMINIPIDCLRRNPGQPRRHFDKKDLQELTESIRTKGVLQPLLVRPLPATYGLKGQKTTGQYQIVAGERRWHAAQAAGLEVVPALVRELSDVEVLEIGVIENVQRADLNPIEEAMAYGSLIREFGRKQAEIAEAVGKSRSHIANALRLLSLPVRAQEYLEEGLISPGHARAILAAPDPQALAEMIVKKSLSVREAENWVKRLKAASGETKKHDAAPDANIAFIERQLSRHIGMKVVISHKTPGGKLSIKYKNLEEFDDVVKRLRQS